MAYKITDSCVACGTCIGECPVEAISAGDIYVIDPNTCIDCGTWRRRLPQRGDHSGITHGYNMEKHARSIMLRACFLGVSVRRLFNHFYRPFGATIIG